VWSKCRCQPPKPRAHRITHTLSLCTPVARPGSPSPHPCLPANCLGRALPHPNP
jgi:hypothetical protein